MIDCRYVFKGVIIEYYGKSTETSACKNPPWGASDGYRAVSWTRRESAVKLDGRHEVSRHEFAEAEGDPEDLLAADEGESQTLLCGRVVAVAHTVAGVVGVDEAQTADDRVQVSRCSVCAHLHWHHLWHGRARLSWRVARFRVQWRWVTCAGWR